MKKYLFAAAFVLSLTAGAQTFNVHKTDGTNTSFPLSEVKNVSVDDTYVTVNKNDDSKKNFRTPDVEKMAFSEGTVDLGAGANCYIVLKEGDYEFTPLHVDGTAIEGVTSATWVWASKQKADDTIQKLISDVRVEDGKVKFHANGYYGNAVLAGMNTNGEIVWTWHIWMPKDEPQQTYVYNKIAKTGVMMLDRGLGAVSADAEDLTDTWGLCYQWGRLTPIYGAHTDRSNETVALTEAVKWTVCNEELGFEWVTSATTATPQQAIANPTVVYCNNGTVNNTWMKSNDALWSPDKKSNYDPCPAGYRISNAEELHYTHLLFDADSANNPWGATYVYTDEDTQTTYTSYWPFMGYGRAYDDACIVHNQHMAYWCNELDVWQDAEYKYPHVWGANNRLSFIQALNGVSCANACMYIRPTVE